MKKRNGEDSTQMVAAHANAIMRQIQNVILQHWHVYTLKYRLEVKTPNGEDSTLMVAAHALAGEDRTQASH